MLLKVYLSLIQLKLISSLDNCIKYSSVHYYHPNAFPLSFLSTRSQAFEARSSLMSQRSTLSGANSGLSGLTGYSIMNTDKFYLAIMRQNDI